MKIAVLGGDGYCGWATALYLSNRGHSVAIVDNFVRRQWDYELDVQTLTPIRPLSDRLKIWQEVSGKTIDRSSATFGLRIPSHHLPPSNRMRWCISPSSAPLLTP